MIAATKYQAIPSRFGRSSRHHDHFRSFGSHSSILPQLPRSYAVRELLFLLPASYALADSFAGGSLGKSAKALDDKLPGRGPFWAMLVLAGLGYLAAGLPAASVAVFWWINRIIPPKQFGGSATVIGNRQLLGSVALHSISLLSLVSMVWAHKPLLQSLGFLVAYVFVAVGLAVMYGDHKKDAIAAGEAIEADDPFNTKVELARGAMFGAVIALMFYQ